MTLSMDNEQISAYGGLLRMSRTHYIRLQIVVFAVLFTTFISTYIFDTNDFFLGNTRLVVAIIALLEVVEMIYVLRKRV